VDFERSVPKVGQTATKIAKKDLYCDSAEIWDDLYRKNRFILACCGRFFGDFGRAFADFGQETLLKSPKTGENTPGGRNDIRVR